ncbi:hypothetical protein BESB_022670 [Besnoitia besnoiti]|uniref:Transmembrane protein n=1 Tax=Besnoitia besnoiti TaxID=94643 RepID=A0A2A9M1B4_BESBE|nr:hypothetical protein BESB_022670 [Besnoitia besnoiti]PFH31775.1 hypothetical protein BESB_022670 [Besnoitia besnoiti]
MTVAAPCPAGRRPGDTHPFPHHPRVSQSPSSLSPFPPASPLSASSSSSSGTARGMAGNSPAFSSSLPARAASCGSLKSSMDAFAASQFSAPSLPAAAAGGAPSVLAGGALRQGDYSELGATARGRAPRSLRASLPDGRRRLLLVAAEARRFAHAAAAFAADHARVSLRDESWRGEGAPQAEAARHEPQMCSREDAQRLGGECGASQEEDADEDAVVSRAKAIQLLLALRAAQVTVEETLAWITEGEDGRAPLAAEIAFCEQTLEALQEAGEALLRVPLLAHLGVPLYAASGEAEPTPPKDVQPLAVASEVAEGEAPFELTDAVLELWAAEGLSTDDEEDRGREAARAAPASLEEAHSELGSAATAEEIRGDRAKEPEHALSKAESGSMLVGPRDIRPAAPAFYVSAPAQTRHPADAARVERQALLAPAASRRGAHGSMRLRRRHQGTSKGARAGGTGGLAEGKGKEEEGLEQELLDFAHVMKEEATRYGEVIQRDRDRLQRTGEAQQRHLDRTHVAVKDTKSLIYGTGFGFFYAMILLVIGCILFTLVVSFILFTPG